MRLIFAYLLHNAEIVDGGEERTPGEIRNWFLRELIRREAQLIYFWRLWKCGSRWWLHSGVMGVFPSKTDRRWSGIIVRVIIMFFLLLAFVSVIVWCISGMCSTKVKKANLVSEYIGVKSGKTYFSSSCSLLKLTIFSISCNCNNLRINGT